MCTWGTSFSKTSFQIGMDPKKYRNKAEMKKHNKTTLHIRKKYTVDVGIIVFLDFSSLPCFCLYFFTSIPLEQKLFRVFPLVSAFSHSFLYQLPHRTRFKIVSAPHAPLNIYDIILQMNMFIASNEIAFEHQPHAHS